MQTLTERALRLAPPGGLFDEAVVQNLFPAISPAARKLAVHRAVRSGEVLRLKPGLYCLGQVYWRARPHPYVVAAMLHSPSHVSLETALSYHGLIPEAVYQVSSVTARRSRSFRTPVGSFSFQRVPANDPRAGVSLVKLGDDAWAFVASPLRAIADTIYLRKEISWKADGLRFLTSSMRIEQEDLHAISMDDLDEIGSSLRSSRTREYLEGMRAELGG